MYAVSLPLVFINVCVGEGSKNGSEGSKSVRPVRESPSPKCQSHINELSDESTIVTANGEQPGLYIAVNFALACLSFLTDPHIVNAQVEVKISFKQSKYNPELSYVCQIVSPLIHLLLLVTAALQIYTEPLTKSEKIKFEFWTDKEIRELSKINLGTPIVDNEDYSKW